MVKKLILCLSVILMILIGILSVNIFNGLTGNVISELEYTRTYTTAICNSTNFCQDYEIKCKDSDLVNFNPITGSAVQFLENWEDPRGNNLVEDLCS